MIVFVLSVAGWRRLFASEDAQLSVDYGRDFACCVAAGTLLQMSHVQIVYSTFKKQNE